ncbi:MAG: hypothetical protein ACR2OE_13170 [Thermomicrobiales bacterium]
MKRLALTFLLASVVSGMAFADPPGQRVSVDLRLTGDDALSQKLAVSLENGLRKHRSLTLARSSEEADLTISSKTNVRWDKLGGRVVLIYTVFVGPALNADEPITGVCYQNAVSKCVKDILRIVDIVSLWNRKS